jgi:hypothetical protein
MSTAEVVFFDLGDTLGSAVMSGGSPPRLEQLRVFPFVSRVLRQLQLARVRLGVISNTGANDASVVNQVLANAGLLGFFEQGLLLYSKETGLLKDSPAVFELAARTAGVPIGRTVYVGEDARERHWAATAGMQVCPHVLLIQEVLDGSPLRFASIRAAEHVPTRVWRHMLADSGCVPLRVSGPEGRTVLAMLSQRMASELVNRQFEVSLLGNDRTALTSDLYLLRDDRAAQSGWQSAAGAAAELFESADLSETMLSSTSEGLLAAVPGHASVESYHLPGAYHGHHEKLIPDSSLLQPFGQGAAERRTSFAVELPATTDSLLSATETFQGVTATRIRELVDRFSGRIAMRSGDDFLVQSRHVHHPEIGRVVDGLSAELEAHANQRLIVRRHAFSHEGRTYHNLEAELIGTLDASERGIVILSAHLDSTAASSPGFDAESDPAPGADDDGSGLAAVLVVARECALMPAPQHTIRFVLFHAEEHGLVGSKAYARDQAQQAAPIVAVFQLDMIGHNQTAPPTFQIHAGYLPSADVQERSVVLGERLQQLVATVAPQLPVPRLFRSDGPAAHQRDPAENRSDHSPFHQRGYAACAVTEDFAFGAPFDDPTAEINPHYHRLSDQSEQIDYEYAAAIARVTAAAMWAIANPQH